MKKILIVLGLLTGLSVNAQNHRSQSFLNDQIGSLIVSNTLQNVTNLLSTTANGALGAGTNILGMQWTNKAGSYILVQASNAGTSTNDVTGINPFKDVDIHYPRNADFPYSIMAGLSAPTNYQVAGTISLRMIGRSGKSGTTTVQIVPLYDDSGTNQPTQAGEYLSFAVAVNGVTPVNAVTNVAAYRIAGAKKLRVYYISSGESTSASDCFITDLRWNSFAP